MAASTSIPPTSTFPKVDLKTWRKHVEEELGDRPFERALVAHTRERLRIEPLYTERDWPGAGQGADRSGFPGSYPFTRGRLDSRRPFLRGALTTAADPRVVASDVVADVQAGVRTLILPFDRAARRGVGHTEALFDDYAGINGVAICGSVDLSEIAGPLLAAGGRLSCRSGSAGCAVAGLMDTVVAKLGAVDAHIDIGADPLAELAAEGAAPSVDDSIQELGRLGRWAAKSRPTWTAVTVSGVPYAAAGAHAVDELAIVLSVAATYVDVMCQEGLTSTEAAEQITLSLSVGSDFLLNVAKLRAARLCFGKLWSAYGAATAVPFTMAEQSPAVLSRCDPWSNLLRGTTAAFAGIIGGADTVAIWPFDAALGVSDEHARRMARNTLALLEEESHVADVIDPAGGSFAVEAMTEKLARQAWARMREMARDGGIVELIRSGRLAEQVEQSAQAKRADLETRREVIVGVSEYAQVGEEPISRQARVTPELLGEWRQLRAIAALPTLDSQATSIEHMVAQSQRGVCLSALVACLDRSGGAEEVDAMVSRPDAAPFEELRDAVDRRGGAEVVIVTMGPLAEHAGRLTWTMNAFAAAGISAKTVDGADALEQAVGASTVAICVCANDKRYAEELADVTASIARHWKKSVVLAGKPGDSEPTWRAAGITHFVFLGANIYELMNGLLDTSEQQRGGADR